MMNINLYLPLAQQIATDNSLLVSRPSLSWPNGNGIAFTNNMTFAFVVIWYLKISLNQLAWNQKNTLGLHFPKIKNIGGFMKVFKNIAVVSVIAFFLGSISVNASAAEKSQTYSPNEAIMHIEQAKVEITHEDFMPPSEHLKAARTASEKVTENPEVAKKATKHIIEAQVKLKEGDKEAATKELNAALELYKSIKK